MVLPTTATVVNAQAPTDEAQFSGGLLTRIKSDAAARQSAGPHNQMIPYRCTGGPVYQKVDTAYEGVKTTSSNWANTANGGGETGRYDRVPVLTTRVALRRPGCLNAHLSAIVGSKKTYPGVASITMFQVTLTPPGAPHRHMVGHYDFPYGRYGPAVALEAENDVDMYASNFFQEVGQAPGDVPPGVYTVDVWWAGGPIGGGGAIGAAFVLSLYLT